jgi:hypothetical protein
MYVIEMWPPNASGYTGECGVGLANDAFWEYHQAGVGLPMVYEDQRSLVAYQLVPPAQ